MKRFFIFIIFLFTCTSLFAAEPPKQIIFFGDSLSDNGNLYNLLFKKVPKSPPYYEGRFSNGPVWADHFSTYFLVKHNIPSINYARGGSTSVFHIPFLPLDLSTQVTEYLVPHLLDKKEKNLYVIWMGANDYLDGDENVDKATTNAVNVISNNIERLIRHGARQFMVLNLPDLAITPYAQDVPFKDNLHELTLAHNKKLLHALFALQEGHPEIVITFVDIYDFIVDMVQNIEKYNQRFNKHIKVTNEACWKGGYTLRKADENDLSYELRRAFVANRVDQDSTPIASAILHSPALSEAYLVGQAYNRGIAPCETPDDYLFWDHVHPSTVAHEMLSQTIIENFMHGVKSGK